MLRRESSGFLRQKQEQWEKEKAESESRPEWFPFGENLTPGGGSPLRKHAAKKEFLKETTSTSTASCSTMTTVPQDSENLEVQEKMTTNEARPAAPQNAPQQQAQHTYPYQFVPAYPFPYHQYPTAFHHRHQQANQDHPHPQYPHDSNENCEKQTQYFAPQYQVIPAGAIPISTISIDPAQICPVDQLGMWAMPPPTGPNGMRYGIPIPAPFVPQIMTTSNCSTANLNGMMLSTSSGNHHQHHQNNSDSSSESGVSGVKDDEIGEKKERKKKQEEEEQRQSTSDYTDDDPIPLTRRSTATSSGRSTCNYAEQIEERRRYEQEEENRERAEKLEIERQRRILEDRRNKELERLRRAERERIEEKERRQEQFLKSMEIAQKEAELRKKAKLYHHVLRGAEEQGDDEQLEELEQKILGVDIQTGRRLLKEVSEVEWHKKQDLTEIEKKMGRLQQQEKSNQSIMSGSMNSGRTRSASISSPSPLVRHTPLRKSLRLTSTPKKEQPQLSQRLEQNEAEHQNSRREQERQAPHQSPPVGLPPPHSPPSRPHLLQNRQDRPLNPQNPQDHLQDHPHQPGQDHPLNPQHQLQDLPQQQDHPHLNLRPNQQDTSRESGRPQSTRQTFAHNHNRQDSEMMLKTGPFYCPINREPETYREEHGQFTRRTSTTTGGSGIGGRHNDTAQSALFGPISTRCSIRGGKMRGMQSPATVRMPQSQRTLSFEESSSGGEDAGSLSPDLNHKNFESPLPSSTENVHPAPNSPPMAKNGENGNAEFKTPIRNRSALGSTMSMLNGDLNTRSDSPSTLLQRLEKKGNIRREEESSISQDVRRAAETNLSRSPSIASFCGSFQNLAIRGSQLNLAGHSAEPSPNLSKFASINSPARQSLTSIRRTTDRQAAVLERLGRLRESLHAGKNYTPPRGNFQTSSRITTPAATPPISPRPVL